MSNYLPLNLSPELQAKRAAKPLKKLNVRLAHYKKHGKRCASCWQYKPVGDFGQYTAAADGLYTDCKRCVNLRALIRKTSGLAAWYPVRDALRAAAPPALDKPADGRRPVGRPELRKYRYKK